MFEQKMDALKVYSFDPFLVPIYLLPKRVMWEVKLNGGLNLPSRIFSKAKVRLLRMTVKKSRP